MAPLPTGAQYPGPLTEIDTEMANLENIAQNADGYEHDLLHARVNNELVAIQAHNPRKKLDATAAPTANDDSANTASNGAFTIGSEWVDQTADKTYKCVDDTPTSAVWVQISNEVSPGGQTVVEATVGTGQTYTTVKDAYDSGASSFVLTSAVTDAVAFTLERPVYVSAINKDIVWTITATITLGSVGNYMTIDIRGITILNTSGIRVFELSIVYCKGIDMHDCTWRPTASSVNLFWQTSTSKNVNVSDNKFEMNTGCSVWYQGGSGSSYGMIFDNNLIVNQDSNDEYTSNKYPGVPFRFGRSMSISVSRNKYIGLTSGLVTVTGDWYSFHVDDNVFYNTTGAIFVSGSLNYRFYSGTIRGNTIYSGGGLNGPYMIYFKMYDVVISGNLFAASVDNYSSGIKFYSGNNVIVSDNIFEGFNEAINLGTQGDTTLYDIKIHDNQFRGCTNDIYYGTTNKSIEIFGNNAKDRNDTHATINRYTCTATEVVGDYVYISGADTVAQANATTEATAPAIGQIIYKPTSTTCRVAIGGTYKTTGLTAAAKYYLSETAGAITNTAPSASGTVKQEVGIAVSTTDLLRNGSTSYTVN